jgi:hypothetical protein
MAPYPFLMNFDGSERAIAACTRERSNTPLQALNMLNDPVLIEAAQGLATRILLEAPGAGFNGRLDYAYELAFGRAPSNTEQQRLTDYYRDQHKLLDGDSALPAKWYPLALEGVERIDAAAWTAVARVLMNTDEFITRE